MRRFSKITNALLFAQEEKFAVLSCMIVVVLNNYSAVISFLFRSPLIWRHTTSDQELKKKKKNDSAKSETRKSRIICGSVFRTGSDKVGELAICRLDLCNLASVKECAKHLLATEPAIHLLINNAGVMMPPYEKTQDGFELQLQSNYLGHFLLTLLLLPRMQSSAPDCRIVNVSSIAYACEWSPMSDRRSGNLRRCETRDEKRRHWF